MHDRGNVFEKVTNEQHSSPCNFLIDFRKVASFASFRRCSPVVSSVENFPFLYLSFLFQTERFEPVRNSWPYCFMEDQVEDQRIRRENYIVNTQNVSEVHCTGEII